MVNRSLRDVVDVKQKVICFILVKLVVGARILNILSLYAPQVGLHGSVKSQFWEDYRR